MTFSIGQKVVCIPRTEKPDELTYNERCPIVGNIYTIRSTRTSLRWAGEQVVRLIEIVNDEHHYKSGFEECWWSGSRFRPIVERKTDTGMAILKKIAADASKKRAKETT